MIIILFLIVFIVYLFTLCPTVYLGDSGELISAAYSLGSAHPPGYPIFVIFGKLFSTIIPFGSIAFRMNLMSSFVAISTCIFLYLFLKNLMNNSTFSSLSFICTSLCFAFSHRFWSQAIISEVYTISMLLISLLLFLLLICYKNNFNFSYLCLFFLFIGIAFTHHPNNWLVIPIFVLFFIFHLKIWMDHPLKIFFIISIFVFGLAIYIFLPIRSLANPTVNWGEPQSLYELLRHVLRKQYKPLGGHRTFSLFLLQLHSFIKYASLQMTLPLLIISFLGWIFAWKNIKMNLFLTILFIVIVLGVIGFVNFQPTHHQEELVSVFFLPAVLVISIWLGYAIFKISKLKFYFILPLFPILPFIVNLPENNHARNTVAYRSAYDMLTIFPRRAVLFVAGDFTAFPIAYLQMVEKYRTDVEIFDDYGSLFPNIYGKRFLELPSPLQSEKRKKTQMYFIEKGRTVYCTLGAEMSNWTPILIPEGLNYRTTGGPSLLTFKKFWLLNSFFSFIDNFNLIDTATVNIINQYRFALGEYFFTQGNANKGIKFYKLAADNEKEFEWLLNNMATMITRRGMPKEAKYFYEKIIILNPWYTTAFIGLGNFALAEKNIVAAENYFKRAVEIEPTSAYAHFNLGNIYSEQKRNIEAIEEYKKAIIYDPNYFSAYKNLASVYIEMNMPKAALEVTEKAIQLKPDDYESHYNKGEIEYALHNPEEAFKSWQNAYNIAHQVYEMYKSNPNDIRVLRAKDCMIRSKERMEKLLGARAP